MYDEVCIDVARTVYEELEDGGMTDESVYRGLHNAVRTLGDQWLSDSGRDVLGDELANGVDALQVEENEDTQSASEGMEMGRGRLGRRLCLMRTLRKIKL